MEVGLDMIVYTWYNAGMSKTSKHPQFTAYIPQEVLDALREEAKKNRRSMNNQLVVCLEQCLQVKREYEQKGESLL